VFDIHGGGLDLQFPHHEDEIAQSCCANGTDEMARYWMHNEMLQVEGKKMSKSLGNFFTVRDLLDQGVPGEVIRFVMLSTHYRKPMDWTEKKREEAEKTLRKWRAFTDGLEPSVPDQYTIDLLADDLNTPAAISQLHWLANDPSHDQAMHKTLLATAQFLGLLTPEGGEWATKKEIDLNVKQVIENLMSERWHAKSLKDWSRADRIRDGLIAAGVEIREGKTSYEYDLTDNFDPAKLEAIK